MIYINRKVASMPLRLSCGEFFGGLDILADRDRYFEAVAETDCRLISIPKTVFLQLFGILFTLHFISRFKSLIDGRVFLKIFIIYASLLWCFFTRIYQFCIYDDCMLFDRSMK